MTDTVPEPTFEPEERWIPADRRWLGLDRRTVGPALTVLGLALVMNGVLPAVNGGVGYHDEVAAGDVMALDGGITFVPEPGWGITAGVRLGDAPAGGLYPGAATVVDGDITLTVRTDVFDGDDDALLSRTEATNSRSESDGDDTVTAERTPITTDQGDQGLMAQVSDPHSQRVLAAFVFDARGVQAVGVEPSDADDADRAAVTRMIASIRHTIPERQ